MRFVGSVILGLAAVYWTVCLVTLAAYIAQRPRPQTVQAAVGIKDGSVLFWKDSLLVKPIIKHTGSDITHAAIILDGYVYEATPPRVHKVLLEDYVKEMATKTKRSRHGFTYFIVQPKESYGTTEVSAMTKYAESQLGRPYMLRGYGKRITRGVFCSELVADILEKNGRIKSSSFRESPGSLFNKIKDIYQ